jgi:hypothetical protein
MALHMKLIQLGMRGGHAKVDDADYEMVLALSRRWHRTKKGYARAGVKDPATGKIKMTLMHCAIMGARGIDHRNGDKVDNQRSNLRLATQAQNAQNQVTRKATRSGVRGVTYHEGSGRWQANCRLDGHLHYLGKYSSVAEAEAAVVAFRLEHMPFDERTRSEVA